MLVRVSACQSDAHACAMHGMACMACMLLTYDNSGMCETCSSGAWHSSTAAGCDQVRSAAVP
jgi:hypothetical protein